MGFWSWLFGSQSDPPVEREVQSKQPPLASGREESEEEDDDLFGEYDELDEGDDSEDDDEDNKDDDDDDGDEEDEDDEEDDEGDDEDEPAEDDDDIFYDDEADDSDDDFEDDSEINSEKCCNVCGLLLPVTGQSSRCSRCEADMGNHQVVANSPSYEIKISSKGVEAWSLFSIGYRNKADYPPLELAFREELKAAVQHFDDRYETIAVGRHGIIAGPEDGKENDAENLLFYNIGEWTAASLDSPCLRFERLREIPSDRPAPTLDGAVFYYRYFTEAVSANFLPSKGFDPLRLSTVTRVSSPRMLGNSRSVWHLVSKSLCASNSGQSEDALRPFALRVTLELGSNVRAAPFRMKDIFDGSIAAMHFYNGKRLEGVAHALARELLISDEEAKRLLSVPRCLGGRDLFSLRADGKIHRINPADHLCHAGELLVLPAASPDTFKMTVELFGT